MTDLTIFVPTRERTAQAEEVQMAFLDTCRGNTEVIFIVSNDDTFKPVYRIMENSGHLRKVIYVDPMKRGMASPLNLGFKAWLDNPRTFPSYAVGFMGDDHRPRTVGWDLQYLDALMTLSGRCTNRRKPGVGMVYGDDLLQGENLPTQIAMTTTIPATLGRMVPHELSHLYTDTYWKEVGSQLDKIKYLPDVVVEHMHPGAGKAVIDAGYEFSGSTVTDVVDKFNFYNGVVERVIPQDVEKLKRLM